MDLGVLVSSVPKASTCIPQCHTIEICFSINEKKKEKKKLHILKQNSLLKYFFHKIKSRFIIDVLEKTEQRSLPEHINTLLNLGKILCSKIPHINV